MNSIGRARIKGFAREMTARIWLAGGERRRLELEQGGATERRERETDSRERETERRARERHTARERDAGVREEREGLYFGSGCK